MDGILPTALTAAAMSIFTGTAVHKHNQQENERIQHEIDVLQEKIETQDKLLHQLRNRGCLIKKNGKEYVCDPLNNLINTFILHDELKAQTIIQTIMTSTPGFDINGIDKKGNIALHIAAQKEKNNIISFLLKQHARINARNWQGYTPLICAVKAGNASTVTLLLKKKGLPDIADDLGMTPLHHASQQGALNIIKLLLANPATKKIIDCIDKHGKTPLIHAINRSHMRTITILLHSEANPNVKDIRGMTAMHYAAQTGNIELATLLLEYGANINTENNQRETPLSLALKADKEEMVNFLLSQSTTHKEGKKAESIEYSAHHISALHRCTDIKDKKKREKAVTLLLSQLNTRNSEPECLICYETPADKKEATIDVRFYFSCCSKMICADCKPKIEKQEKEKNECPFCNQAYELLESTHSQS
jgi:ankyrin repeat protein